MQHFVTNLPLEVQISLSIVLIFTLLFHINYNQKTVIYGPTILTTCGILATFCGIALGLNDFDTADIQSSVPSLLAGLKTAFWASVAGVGGALLLKLRHFFLGLPQSADHQGASDDITAADLASLLKGIQQALIGTEEATLVSQLKLLRQDTNDRLDALGRAQQEALTKLSDMGSKALVEALRDVIKDFNAKISEQFGDNFKQLNEAVGKLLVWQDQYKAHIEQLTAQQNEVASAMQSATGDYRLLVDRASVFSGVASDLSGLLNVMESQKQQIAVMLNQLGSLLHAASGSLPEIEAKVVTLTTQLGDAVTANQREVSRSLTENVLLIKNSIQTAGQDFGKINEDFNKHLGDVSTKMREQVAVLDAALTEELKKSLESLGRQLAALSEKFVSDYSPLTDKLHRLVSVAGANA